jgi:hypothetical protein
MLNEINGPLAVLIIVAYHVFLLRLRLGKAPPRPAGAPPVALRRAQYGAGCSEDAGAENTLTDEAGLGSCRVSLVGWSVWAGG